MKFAETENRKILLFKEFIALVRRRFDRRVFFGLLSDGVLVAVAAGSAYAVTRFLRPRRGHGDVTFAVVPKPASAIAAGSGLLFAFGRRPALIVRDQVGELTAFLAICTHLDCTVTFDSDRQLIVCPCHQGVFDLEGDNMSGPPPRPLERLRVEQADDAITTFLE